MWEIPMPGETLPLPRLRNAGKGLCGRRFVVTVAVPTS